MPRFALQVSYDGGPFHGWQWQEGLPSVQGRIEAALRTLQADVGRIQGSGRTDSGVHALAQVFHVDLARDWDPFRLSEALNFHLKPDPIAILAAAKVQDDFSARFSTISRRYLYRISTRRAPPTFARGTVWHVARPMARDAMNEAAKHLIGLHDFTSFRSSICQAKSPVKTLDELFVEAYSGMMGEEIRIHAKARSFLHHQIRSIVGSLAEVGFGRWTPHDMKDALEARDRAACGPVAPAHGLYFMEANYDPDPFKSEGSWAGNP